MPPSAERDDEVETARLLFRILRRVLEQGTRVDVARLVDVACRQLTRPGRAGARLSDEQRRVLKREIALAAGRFVDLSDDGALARFCREAARAACGRLPRAAHARPISEVTDDARALARAALLGEYASSHDDEDLVRRAVTRALREKRRVAQHTVRIPVDEDDPLRDILDLPRRGAVRLPPTDLRVHMAKGELPSLMREAARFSEKTLRPILGEELWGMCRPVGFADRKQRVVVVQVASAPLAHEVSLRKNELLRRLRAVPGFEGVADVRFRVEERKVLPLLR